MDTRLRALAGLQEGAFSAAQARERGVPSQVLREAVRHGELIRVRRGAYVTSAVWAPAGPDERYRLTALAVARSRPGDALSHHAAIAMYRLPLWGHDPQRIDLEADVGKPVGRGSVWLHPRSGTPVLAEDGVPVVPVARAIVRTALTMGRDCAVVAGDAALHRGLVSLDELLAEAATLSVQEGRRRACEAVLCMDPKAESVGESRTRLIVHDLGYGWESQVVITDERGAAIARVGLLVEGLVLEFDGRVKYRLDETTDPEQLARILWAEKRREDAIRRRGYPVERVVWSELDRPGLLGARIRGAIPRATPEATSRPGAVSEAARRRA